MHRKKHSWYVRFDESWVVHRALSAYRTTWSLVSDDEIPNEVITGCGRRMGTTLNAPGQLARGGPSPLVTCLSCLAETTGEAAYQRDKAVAFASMYTAAGGVGSISKTTMLDAFNNVDFAAAEIRVLASYQKQMAEPADEPVDIEFVMRSLARGRSLS